MAAYPEEVVPAKTKLTLWDTTSLIVGIIIGAGIFRTPGDVFGQVNGPWQGIGVWVLGGLVSLVGALCFAELASTFPRSGGEYVYLTRAYGRPVGFLFAWDQLTLIRSAGSSGIIAIAFGEYTCRLLSIKREAMAVPSSVIAIIAVLVFTLINLRGVHLGKRTQNVLTVLKILSIAGLIIAGLGVAMGFHARPEPAVFHGTLVKAGEEKVIVRQRDQTELLVKITPKTEVWINGSTEDADEHNFTVADLPPGEPVRVVADPETPEVALSIKTNTRSLWLMIGIALIPVLWTYAGWHEAAYVVAEVREERRTIPLALLLGTGCVVVIYVAVTLACLAALGFEEASQSSEIAADVLKVFGPWGEKVMALLVMISCLGAIHGTIFTSSRIFAEVGRDHALFAPLARWDPHWGTPVIALIVQGAVTIAMVLLGLVLPGKNPFLNLLFCTSAAFWVFFLLTGISLFILRYKDSRLARPFRVPFYPIVPVAFCLACVLMIVSSVHDFFVHTLVGLGIVALGIPLYFLSESMNRPQRTAPGDEPAPGA